jgi:hypothetical protein
MLKEGSLAVFVFMQEALGGQPLRRAATITGEGETSKVPLMSLRHSVVALSHDYGQSYPRGEGRVVIGPRINFLTASDDCDPIAATPHHKNVRVRLVPLDPVNATAAAANAARALAVAAA